VSKHAKVGDAFITDAVPATHPLRVQSAAFLKHAHPPKQTDSGDDVEHAMELNINANAAAGVKKALMVFLSKGSVFGRAIANDVPFDEACDRP
jgi:hypothetical protein